MTERASIDPTIRELVYRHERAQVQGFIEDVKSGTADCFFLNLFAPRGFGKTTLLQLLWEEYKRVLPASLVQADAFCRGSDEAFALCDLLVHIIRHLSDRLPKIVIDLPVNYEHLTDEEQLASLLLGLVAGARDFEKVTLLLFDDYDAIPAEKRGWLEERVFGQLVRTKKAVVILTSEFELRFTDIDLRMRLENHELLALSPELISSALPEEYESIAEDIYGITGGVPELTEEFLRRMEAAHVFNAADFRASKEKLIKKYYRAYIEKKVLKDLAPTMRETILALAVLQQFDVRILKGILPEVLPRYYQNCGTAEYLNLIENMGSWVQWRMQGGYTLNPALQTALRGYIAAEKPGLSEKVNQAAASFAP